MPLSIASPPREIVPRVKEAIQAAIPDAEVEVKANGTHFEIRVRAASFEGQRTLARQRKVLASIKHLMDGDNPPVHAIDVLETGT